MNKVDQYNVDTIGNITTVIQGCTTGSDSECGDGQF